MLRSVRVSVIAAVVVCLVSCSPAEPKPLDLGPLPLDAWVATHVPTGASQAEDPAVAEAKARCMAEQGFQYVPARPVEIESVEVAEPPGPPRGTRAFAEEYGYGVAWQTEHDTPVAEEAAEPDPADPNEQLREAMSENERAAWTRALIGAMDDPPTEDGPAAPRWQDWGCTGRALWDHDRSKLAYVDPGWLEISAELEAVELAAEGHADVLAAQAQWRECMTAEGFGEWRAPENTEESIREASYSLVDPARGAVVDPVGLGALAERERAAATADWDCRAETDYDVREHSARSELQAAALERLTPAIDAWLDTYWADATSD